MKSFQFNAKQKLAIRSLSEKKTAFIIMDRGAGLSTLLVKYMLSQLVLDKRCLYVPNTDAAKWRCKEYLHEFDENAIRDTNITFLSMNQLESGIKKLPQFDLIIFDGIYPYYYQEGVYRNKNAQVIYGINIDPNLTINLSSSMVKE